LVLSVSPGSSEWVVLQRGVLGLGTEEPAIGCAQSEAKRRHASAGTPPRSGGLGRVCPWAGAEEKLGCARRPGPTAKQTGSACGAGPMGAADVGGETPATTAGNSGRGAPERRAVMGRSTKAGARAGQAQAGSQDLSPECWGSGGGRGGDGGGRGWVGRQKKRQAPGARVRATPAGPQHLGAQRCPPAARAIARAAGRILGSSVDAAAEEQDEADEADEEEEGKDDEADEGGGGGRSDEEEEGKDDEADRRGGGGRSGREGKGR